MRGLANRIRLNCLEILAEFLVNEVLSAILPVVRLDRNGAILYQLLINNPKIIKRVNLFEQLRVRLLVDEGNFRLDNLLFLLLLLGSVFELGMDEVLQSWLALVALADVVDEAVRAEVGA